MILSVKRNILDMKRGKIAVNQPKELFDAKVGNSRKETEGILRTYHLNKIDSHQASHRHSILTATSKKERNFMISPIRINQTEKQVDTG